MIRDMVRRSARVGRLASAPRSTTAYLGWSGHGNVGDDAIRVGQELVNAGRPFATVPVHDMDRTLAWLAASRGSRLPDHLLIGGGTLIGRPEWLDRLQSYIRVRPTARIYVWGAGVEDPGFRGTRSHATADSLQLWSSVLRDVSHVGIRGPRSQELLASVGISSEVVGDPALVLRPSGSQVVSDAIALNLAATEDSYASTDRDWRRAVLNELRATGLTINLFAMDNADVAAAHRIAPPDMARNVYLPPDPATLVDWLAGHSVVVSERLHGNILAASSSTPFVSLDYRPKCADFAASVGMLDFNIPINDLTQGHVTDLVAAARNDRDAVSARLTSHVDDLRERLAHQPWPA